MRLRHLCLGLSLAALCLVLCPRAAQAYHCETMIGAVHNAGVYYFAAAGQGINYLEEGTNEAAALGSYSVKVELDAHDLYNTWTATNSAKYPWNSSWTASGGSTTVLSISQMPYFRSLFANPAFTTYVMTLYCPNIGTSGGGESDEYWTNGTYPNCVSPVPAADLNAETTQVQNLCANLLASYSGKTFVIENWEADSALQDIAGASVTSPTTINANLRTNMAEWISARYKGVHNAMAAKGSSTSNCYCAFEVNTVKFGIEEAGGTETCNTAVDDVLPNTSTDYASYSAYDSMYVTSGDGEYSFANCCNWICLHMPSTVLNGKNLASLGVGEFGVSANWHPASDMSSALNNVLGVVTSQATNGTQMPYCMYWNIYDNDLQDTSITPPVNGNNAGVTGYWMIKPDGTPDAPWHLWRWQCITTDSVRSSTTKIKAALTNTYTSAFTTSGLGTGWTTSNYAGDITFTYASNSFTMKIANGTPTPYGLATVNVATVSSLGRALEPGEYCEYPMVRNSNAGIVGAQVFGDSAGSAIGAGTLNTFDIWDNKTSAFEPISYYWDSPIAGNNVGYGGGFSTYNFNTSEDLGMRLDSADSVFATVSFYWNGAYLGSWLYPTTDTTLATVPLFYQDSGTGDTATFGNIAIYQN